MKKFIKNNIIGFVLGAIIFSSITVAAYSVLANDIGYTPKDNTWKKANGEDITNVKDAIDELYTKSSSDNYDNKEYKQDGLFVYDNRVTILDGGYFVDDNGTVWVNITFKSNIDDSYPRMIIYGLPKKVEKPFTILDSNNNVPFTVSYDGMPNNTTNFNNRIDYVTAPGYYSAIKQNQTYTLKFKY